MMPQRQGRHDCPTPGCGGSLGYTGEKQKLYGGHHATVFRCGECGCEVLRG